MLNLLREHYTQPLNYELGQSVLNHKWSELLYHTNRYMQRGSLMENYAIRKMQEQIICQVHIRSSTSTYCYNIIHKLMDDEKILFLILLLLFFRLLGLLHGIVSTPFDLSLSIVVYFVKHRDLVRCKRVCANWGRIISTILLSRYLLTSNNLFEILIPFEK